MLKLVRREGEAGKEEPYIANLMDWKIFLGFVLMKIHVFKSPKICSK